MRTIVCKTKNQQTKTDILKSIQTFQDQVDKEQIYKDKGSLQIRYTTKKLAISFIILDKKILWIDTQLGIRIYEQPNLFTDSPPIVKIAEGYFEYAWKEAKST
jgi:hypothetical protein